MNKLKSFIVGLTIVATVGVCAAQESKTPFEGEIHFNTFANYCDYINKNGLMPGGNGIHSQTLIIKGDKGKLIDNTAGTTTVWDMSTGDYVTFVEELKKGLEYKDNIDAILVLAPRDTKIYGKYIQKLLSNTIALTNEVSELEGRPCVELKGTIVREQGGMESKYGIKVFCDTTIAMPKGCEPALYGLSLPGLPMKWSYKYDGGRVPMVGELSAYWESTVTDVIPREVSDSEFARPGSKKSKRGEPEDPNVLTGYKMTTTSNTMSMMGYFKAVNKNTQARIEKERQSGEQEGYDSFQTSGEWEF